VPFISPAGAVGRARELYDRVGGDWVAPTDAALAWGLGAKSSANLQTISALLAYGLIEAARQDGARRVRLSELASRLFRADPPLNAEEEQQALVEAALKPKLIAEYAGRWAEGRPSDAVSIDDLKLRHKFTHQAAVRFLQVFDDAMWFVRGGASVVGSYNNPERGGTRAPRRDARTAHHSGRLCPMEGWRCRSVSDAAQGGLDIGWRALSVRRGKPNTPGRL